jgi:hypothetical protein
MIGSGFSRVRIRNQNSVRPKWSPQKEKMMEILSFKQGFGSALFNADPDTDPDPAFFLIADPDSESGSRIRIQGLIT